MAHYTITEIEFGTDKDLCEKLEALDGLIVQIIGSGYGGRHVDGEPHKRCAVLSIHEGEESNVIAARKALEDR